MSAHEFDPKEVDTTESDHSGGGSDKREEAFTYYHDIREQLLKEAAESVGETYGRFHIDVTYPRAPLTLTNADHKPSCGLKPFDVTAVHEDQLSWGEEIEHRPIELLMFNPPGGENPAKRAIGHLRYDGKLVVDYRQEPVQNFPSLPLLISSKAEGWRIEAWMRSDQHMEFPDIVARLPVFIETDPAGHRSRVPEYQAGTLRERARKFQHLTGLVSWKSEGDPRIKEFMDSLRSPAHMSRNQTIGRDLTDLERTSLASLNIGTRPDPAKRRQNPRELHESGEEESRPDFRF